ncbi:hypothetical protein ACUH93_00700 [Dermabacteraceae bacterium P7006]
MIEYHHLADIFGMIAAADTRFPPPEPPRRNPDGTQRHDNRFPVWQRLLEGLRPEDVNEAAVRLTRRVMVQVIQPGHLIEEVKQLRKERTRSIDESTLVPPAGLPSGSYPFWRRKVTQLIGDGYSQDEAIQLADAAMNAPRIEGPTSGRVLALEGVR